MKKINISQEKIFEIAKILKDKIPEEKIYLHQYEKKIIIQLRRKIDLFILEEIKTLIQLKYPDIKVIFQSNF